MTDNYRRHKYKFGLCIDWETSGSFFDNRIKVTDRIQGIQLGAAVFQWEDFKIVDTLKCDIKFDDSKYEWQEGAEKIHGLSRDYLNQHGITSEEAAVNLASMVLNYFGTDEVMLLGYNTIFDVGFTEQLLIPHELMFKMCITKVDIASLAYIMFGLHRSNDVFDLLGLPKRENHDALEDVKMTIEAAKLLRALFLEKV